MQCSMIAKVGQRSLWLVLLQDVEQITGLGLCGLMTHLNHPPFLPPDLTLYMAHHKILSCRGCDGDSQGSLPT